MRGCDLFDPKTTEMDSTSFSRGDSSPGADFGFAFNDSNFSDRLLRIEILGDGDEGCCTSMADWARHRKRRREENKKKDNGGTLSIEPV